MSYTAQQLVALAAQICRIPGKTTYIGQFLNLILADYAQTVDEDVIRKTTTLAIGPQTTIPFFYSLPSDYLRMFDIYYNVDGTVFTPKQFTLEELDASYTASGIADYPEWWATDMAQTPPQIAFYPPPNIALTVNIRYRPQTADITTPETSSTVPWFPNQRVLLKDLCVACADLADDVRGPGWEAEVERRLRKYLVMSDDKEGFSQTVTLDPRQFRKYGQLPPSKKLGF